MKSRIGTDTVRTFLFSIFGTVVGIATGIYLAKTLGPAGKGLFSSVQVLQGGITAITSSAAAALTHMLTTQRRQMGDILKPLGVLLATTTLIAWAFLAIYGLRYGFNVALLIAASVIPAAIVLSWRNNFYIGIGQVKNLNYQALALSIASLIAVVAGVQFFHGGALGAVAAWSLCLYGAAIFVLAHALRFPGSGERFSLWSDYKTLVHYGSQAGLAGLVGFLNYRVDSLVLMALLGMSGFGIYSVAVAGGELLFMVSRSVGMGAAHEIATVDPERAAELTAKSNRMSTLVLAAAALVLVFIGPPLITLVYGARFSAAGLPLQILLPGIVAYAAPGNFSAYFYYRMGQPMLLVILGVVAIALQALLSLILIPRLGIPGAAIGSTVTYIVTSAAATFYFCRSAKVSAISVWVPTGRDIANLVGLVRGLLPTRRAQMERTS